MTESGSGAVPPRGDPGSGRRRHCGGGGVVLRHQASVVGSAADLADTRGQGPGRAGDPGRPRRRSRPSRCWPASRPTAGDALRQGQRLSCQGAGGQGRPCEGGPASGHHRIPGNRRPVQQRPRRPDQQAAASPSATTSCCARTPSPPSRPTRPMPMPASPRPRWIRTRTLKSYERLIAPFDGQVTARFADPGALVQNATTSQTAAQPVVTVSDDTRLRIDAYVQQDVAPFVHEGDDRRRSWMPPIPAVPSRRRSRAFPASSIRAPAPCWWRWCWTIRDKFLLGGSFAYMTLHVPVTSATQVPVGALITRGNDQFVAVVGAIPGCTTSRSRWPRPTATL